MVEEGIRASNVPAVLEKCVNDLLDLTDLVRGKLGVQVRVSPAGPSHIIQSSFHINQSIYFSCLQDLSGIKGINHAGHAPHTNAAHATVQNMHQDKI